MVDVAVSFRLHWINRGWLQLFTSPFVEVDGGQAVRCRWDGDTVLDVPPGLHSVRAFVRYPRLIPGDGGAFLSTVRVPEEGGVRIEVTNGMLNQSPFVARTVPAGDHVSAA